MKRTATLLVMILVSFSLIILSACSSGSSGIKKTMKWSSPPVMTIDKNKSYTATIKTNYGNIVIELYPQDAPITVNNFVFLARQGFYDGLIFHRVVAAFVIQGGDPLGTGTGGPGYEFADEIVNKDYSIGTLAMANSGPNTNGSQFFICLTDLTNQTQSFKAKAYNIFGKVTSGLDVVRKIGNVKVDADDKPVSAVVMNSVTIEEK